MTHNPFATRLRLAAFLLALGTAPLLAQQALGPADGAGLPPTDTARVAVGTLAPDFTLAAHMRGRVTLSQFRGKKNVILVFYRGHW